MSEITLRRIAIRSYRSIVKADLRFGQITVVIGPSDSGKCLGHGTLVLMSDGTVKAAEEIKEGDRLAGPSGACVVLATSRGRGRLFEIRPKKNDSWVCNAEHVLTLINGTTSEIVDIGLDEYLVSTRTFRATHKLFIQGVDEFEDAPPPPRVDPYFLGLWFGDGTKTTVWSRRDKCRKLKVVSITKGEQIVRETCELEADRWGLHVKVYDEDRCPMFFLFNKRGKGNPLLEAMRAEVGGELRVPESILRGDRETRLQFLAGFLDTDGYLANNCFEITQKREDWARAAWWIARSLGLTSTIRPKKARCQGAFEGTYYRVMISGHTDQIPTRIPRKQAGPRRSNRGAGRMGFDVEPLGVGDYYGFALDGDGRFFLEDFTVTHNSNLVRALRDWAYFATGQDMITTGHGVCRVAVAVGEQYKVVFEKNDGRNKGRGPSRYVVKNGETGEVISYEKIGRSIPAEITELTRIRPVVIGDRRQDKDLLKINIHFSEQDDPWFLINPKVWSPSQTSRVIGKVAGLEALILANKDLKLKHTQKTKEAKHLRDEARKGMLELLDYKDLDKAMEVLERTRETMDQIALDETVVRDAKNLLRRIKERRRELQTAKSLVAVDRAITEGAEQSGLLKDYGALADATDLIRLIAGREQQVRATLARIAEKKTTLKALIEQLKTAAKAVDLICPLCNEPAHDECRANLEAQAGE